MDLTIWVLGLTILNYLSIRMILSPSGPADLPKWIAPSFLTITVTLPAARPEGAAIALAFSLALAGYFAWRRKLALSLWAVGAFFGAAAVAVCITLWRLSYFGYPVPNTFYAKESTGIIAQAKLGAIYAMHFLLDSATTSIVAICCGLAAYGWFRKSKVDRETRRRDATAIPALFLIGLCGMYAALGGDHFQSSRFLQPLVSVLSPIAGAASILVWRALLKDQRRPAMIAASLALVGIIAAPIARFANNGGGIRDEFRIADRLRYAGQIFEALPQHPSVGVIAAGGIKRTYSGFVYDIMGLNWVEMAHAVPDKTGAFRDHGAFEESLFLTTEPDVLLPGDLLSPCQPMNVWPNGFIRMLLKGMTEDKRFTDFYAQACIKDLQFYIRRDRLSAYSRFLQKPQGETW